MEVFKTKALTWNNLKQGKIHWLLMALVISALMLHHRRPDALFNAQFWMEDGEVFFLDSYRVGFLSIFIPYAEYLHVFPRTISIIGHYLVPIGQLPLFYNIMSLTAFLLTIVYIWFRGPENKATSLLMILSMTMLPVYNEVFMNITNQQWSLAFILLMPLCYFKNSKFWSVLDACIILIVGLSGPFATIFFPIVLIRFYFLKDELMKTSHLKLPFIAYTFTACLQLALILFFPMERSSGQPGLMEMSRSAFELFYQQFAVLTVNTDIVFLKTNLSIVLGFSLFIGMLILEILTFRSLIKNKQSIPFVFISAGLLMFLSTIYGFRKNPGMLDPVSTDRYFYIPTITLFWAALHFIETKKYWQYFLLIGFAAIYFFKDRIIPVKVFKDMHWEKYIHKFDGKEPFEIPINPPDKGWIIKVIPKE